MKRTTTPAAPGRRSVAAPQTAARARAPWLATAIVTMALLAAGCTAPEGASTSPPPAVPTAAQDTRRPVPGPSQSTVGQQPTAPAVPVPASTIPVRPATPLAQAPADAPLPRSLTVEGTTINMAIVEVGVSPDGAMEIPDPFDVAGWYRFGPAPGAATGTAVVAAHVDTTSDTAPFSQLKSLAPGTLVTVQREAAAPVTFRVTGVELMSKDAFDGASIFRRDGPPQLKLVTCGGRWLDERQDYGDNVIVTAVPA